MTERYTAKDVREIFETFVEVAGRAGFDTTGWILQTGDQYRAYKHFKRDEPGGGLWSTLFRDQLGNTAREAYQTLSTRLDTLNALADLQREQAKETNA
jgi:hypothetical protein